MPGVLNIPVLNTADASFDAAFQARLHWSGDTDVAIESRVAEIIAAVRRDGDQAVLGFTQQFYGLAAATMAALEIAQAEMKAAYEALPDTQRDALKQAADRIRAYHEAQKRA